MLAAQKTLLLLFVGVSLAHDFITSAQLKNIEERLRATEETLTELKKENEALRIFTKASSDKLESIQAENKAKKVAFSAGLLASGSQHFGPFDTRKTLVYQKNFINTGNAYDPNNGKLCYSYFFIMLIVHSPHQSMESISSDFMLTLTLLTKWQSTNANGSNGVVLSLQKGDEVYTQLRENSWVFDDENSYTSFSGFLLFPF
uniref:Cerebellin 13 n=1 Tax=Sinocyclocheilus rhinocerous TaxID=307959 RepID=A0A673LP64_9TELE